MTSIAPFGSWRSPLTAALIAASDIAIGWPAAARGQLFWTEMRPVESGRYVIVRRDSAGAIADVTPAGYNARTLVHEYGGGMYTLYDPGPTAGLVLFFSNFDDQRVYRQELTAEDAGEPRPITPEPASPRALRYADGRVTPDGRLLVCVRERHDADGVINELVAVPTSGGEPVVLAAGHDFYAAPRISPDGSRLAWLSWDNPAMPWDETELWLAELTAAGGLAAERRVAGGPGESVLQPAWSPDGRLHFVSDRSGWWNLYRLDGERLAPLAPRAAEFAGPSWVFGLRDYDFLPDGRLVARWREGGLDHLGLLPASGGGTGAASGGGTGAASGGGTSAASGGEGEAGMVPVASPFTALAFLTAFGEQVALIGGSATQDLTLALVDPDGGGVHDVKHGSSLHVEPGFVSVAEAIEFPTSYEPGSVTGPLLDELAAGPVTAHALYYGPANQHFAPPENERPPLIVISHGGPTSATTAAFDSEIQFWTSRGFAVVDVNYGGSSGYGRRYRERLKGNWGIVDTVDCINAARYLAGRGDVDPARIAVRGGSAGGYTTLNALTRHRFFAAGASYFGLADLEAFVHGGTHKFEAQYLLRLVGPYPESADVYRERSPIHHVDDISCPVIVFQGLEDEIVPPRQAEIIVEALRAKGLPYAYLAFEGEQHGFRKAENMTRSLEAELYFYGRVFGFEPADEIEPVEIANL